ncbi:uncharacterized protein LOC122084810 [Macadamia integrifolia]|uniref:uncharacterized protein LOC122084810 n=1 Tax=Macadamia integrifolia TaxID=60698 RepID=UPI001C4F7FA7|nr:uncharacterized protein LOC122084810 [Macadamia integrifolia]
MTRVSFWVYSKCRTMGICISTQSEIAGKGKPIKESMAMVIHEDGKLQELKERRKVGDVILQNPNCFLCNSDSIYPDTCVPPLPGEEELEFDQIYFLLPLSKQRIPISLTDLCNLAVKASNALCKQDFQIKKALKPKSSAGYETRHRWNSIQIEPCLRDTERQWENSIN